LMGKLVSQSVVDVAVALLLAVTVGLLVSVVASLIATVVIVATVVTVTIAVGVASGVVALAPAALAVLKHLNLHTQTHTTDSKMDAGERGRQSHASTAQFRAGRDQRRAAQQRDRYRGRERLSQTDRQHSEVRPISYRVTSFLLLWAMGGCHV